MTVARVTVMAESQISRSAVPRGTYAGGARSPVVYVYLCPTCAGYAPALPAGAPESAHCQGCGAYVREVHRFQALIMSAANGGCMCDLGHRQVTGDLPTEESARAVMLEVMTRPGLAGDVTERRRASLRSGGSDE